MNQKKAAKLLREQTPIALKVYEAVPAGASWTRSQIMAEMTRLGHTATPNMKVIEGCLYSLIDDGLIKERTKGNFIRTTITVPTIKKPTLHIAKKPEVEKVEQSNFDKLNQLLTGIAASLNELQDAVSRAKKLSDDIELECMEAREGNNEELQKLRALKSAMEALTS